MKIDQVRIHNFRCITELDIKLTQTHALVGENGSGKTSVLEAISIATSGGLPYLNEQDFNNKDLGNISIEVVFDEYFISRIPDGYTTQDVICKSVLLTAHRRERAAGGKVLSEPFVIEKYAVPLEYDNHHKPEISFGETRLNIPPSIAKTESGYESPRKTGSSFKFTTNRLTLQNEMINFPDIFYFDRDREEQAKIGYNSLLQKVAKDLNWRYRKDWNQANIKDKWNAFYREVIDTVESPKTGRIIEPIVAKMKSLVGVDFVDLELGLVDIEQPFTHTFFSRRNGTNQIDQKRFGSGLSILLAYFLLDIISKLSKGKIIFLIDEPELHLHPQLQQSLFKELVNSDYQTIYTTQSDCFINIAEWQSITRFQTDHQIFPISANLLDILDGQSVETHLNEIKVWHQHESLFFKEDNQIFFARRCLLVEGPAEKYGLPILSQKLGIPLDQITIMSCNGKGKIPYYQLLSKAFGIPFFTLFDLDGGRLDVGDNKRPHDNSLTDAIYTFSSSFESVLGITPTSSHKTSDVLILMDQIIPQNIPQEIHDSILAIEIWNNS